MKKLLSITILSILCSSSFAQEWEKIGNFEYSSYYFHKNSSQNFNKNESIVFGGIVKSVNNLSGLNNIRYSFINPSDCIKNNGLIYYYDLNKVFQFENSWEYPISNSSSIISLYLCAKYQSK